MAELKGTFYGVSVGPGDPELLTLQAVRLIRKCPVLAAPQTSSGQMLALDIARSALGKALDGKTIVPLHFAMSRDPAVLAASHKAAVQAVRPYLDAGQDTAMLNLGDVSIYATFGYLQRLLEAEGYPTAMAACVMALCSMLPRPWSLRSTTTPIRFRSCLGTTTRTPTPLRWSVPLSTSLRTANHSSTLKSA